MGDARRRSLALKTPSNLQPRPPQRPRTRDVIERRMCLMAQAGKCRTEFHVAGAEGRFMCSDHWLRVPHDTRQKLAAEFEAIRTASVKWKAAKDEAVAIVARATATHMD